MMVVENIARVAFRHVTVRVWQERTPSTPTADALQRRIADLPEPDRPTEEQARSIAAMIPHANAVEVVDNATGNGVVFYPSWP